MIDVGYGAILMALLMIGIIYVPIFIIIICRFRVRRGRIAMFTVLAMCLSVYGTLRVYWPIYDLFIPMAAAVTWPLYLPLIFAEAILSNMWIALVLSAVLLAIFGKIAYMSSSRSSRLALILTFSILLFELPLAAQAAWSDWQITRQADQLALTSRAILPFRESVWNYFHWRRNWFEYLHGHGCLNGSLYLWSYRAGRWQRYDRSADHWERNLDRWCG